MKPNPGGQLDPDEILGRDELIDSIWDTLEGRNIYINDLRRIGKTMILNKMQAEPPKGWLVSKRDLGGLRTANEFSTRVYRDALTLLGHKTKTLRRMGDLLGKLSGTEIAGVLKLPDGSIAPWKETLTRTFADLHEEQKNSGERVVFLWDEVPFLLDNIRMKEGPESAMEVLDVLRSLSQDYPNVRLVLTGSVGIHHVLTQLRRDGYNNSPLNTFERVSPGPLKHSEASLLAKRLLEGSRLSVTDTTTCGKAIATMTGDVPFYIHRLISRLPKGKPHNEESCQAQLIRELVDADNDWDLAHYRTRLSKYYPDGNDETVTLSLLDSLAVANSPLPLHQLINETKSTVERSEDEQIRELLKLLLADHYLTRNEEGHFSFRLEIIRRWWVLDRGL